MPNVYVTRRIPQAGLDLLTDYCDHVEMNPDDRVLTRDELLAAVTGRDGVLCLLTDHIDEAVFAAAGPACRVFANYAVGYNNIDLDAARRNNVRITNTPGVLTDATADMAWALLFSAARRVVESDQYLRSGKWDGWGPMQFLGFDVTGKTLGVIGAGRIGTCFALKSAGFDMPVLYTGRQTNRELETKLNARRVSMEELLAESDFVSVHVALNDKTTHLIDASALKQMKSTAVLINTSRGPVVDERALVDALQNHTIGAAGLDVFEDEPALAPGLAALQNVVICPHIASATITARTRMAVMAATNLISVLKGNEPPNAVV